MNQQVLIQAEVRSLEKGRERPEDKITPISFEHDYLTSAYILG